METEPNVLGRVSSVDFAIYLTHKAIEKGISINVTKLQKLLYLCYGLYLAATNEQLLDVRPQAWYYGPFFPNIHRIQKSNKDTLENLVHRINLEDFAEFDYIIVPILEHFGNWSASELVNWTHEKGMAWDKKYNIQNEKHTSLDNFDIISDFEKFIVREGTNAV